MHVLVALEARYDRTPDGCVWSDGTSNAAFWQRYLDVFDGVTVLARVRDVQTVNKACQRADAPGVAWAPVPYFVGPWQYLRQYTAVQRAVAGALPPGCAIILRVPGTIGTCVHRLLHGTKQPHGVEVVGDPRDVFAPGGVRSLVRPFMRWWYPRHLRRQCAGAAAAAYVTTHILQERYPPHPDAFTTSYSSIELDDEWFVPTPHDPPPPDRPLKILTVGSLEQLYKGPDVLIRAVARLNLGGLKSILRIVGDGHHRAELEQLARDEGVTEVVDFAGRLPAGEAMRAVYDDTDLFVLPSRTEGLPRALLEAMARGLPCLGSDVGGFAELLDATERVKPGDADALALTIASLARDPARMARLAQRNLEFARGYHAETLRARRRAFYAALRDATHAWLAKSRP